MPWNREYYRAFMTLMDSRRPGMSGPAPIPLSEIVAYLAHFGVACPDERERWIRMLRALDAVYLRHAHDRLRQERERRRG